jgi:hypothetical protein
MCERALMAHTDPQGRMAVAGVGLETDGETIASPVRHNHAEGHLIDHAAIEFAAATPEHPRLGNPRARRAHDANRGIDGRNPALGSLVGEQPQLDHVIRRPLRDPGSEQLFERS